MRTILAIDTIEGKCVRLTKGDFGTRKVYNNDPLEVAKEAEDNGIGYLHLVDLDGARNGKPENLRVLEKLAARTTLSIDFGGGIRKDDDIVSAFNAGANQITAGSIAVTDVELFVRWLSLYGHDKLILGADFRDGKVSTAGWIKDSETELIPFLKDYISKGVKYTICTDIEKDGMLKGPATDLYKKITGELEISLIASGGISSVKDLEDIEKAGCEGRNNRKSFLRRQNNI